ncbi:MAG: glycosyltransferase [Muribaculaceae bacterium]|nr:glycosyltransferase [Muribaculaceae bacterium]
MNPLFSIITVTRNAEQTIPATLKSVAEQTCSLYEFIVIDGASTDQTVELAKNARIKGLRLISEPDRGLYDAMNKGLGMAQGDYVIFLNAGDAFHSPDTLQLIADAVMDNDYPGIVYGQTDIVNADRQKIADRHLLAPANLTLDSFKTGMTVCHQAFIVLRKLTNNYDTRYKYSADYEWCIRCLQRSQRNHYIDDTIIDYLSEGLTTRHHKASLLERFDIMSKYYGFCPTLWRHLGFFWRNLNR